MTSIYDGPARRKFQRKSSMREDEPFAGIGGKRLVEWKLGDRNRSCLSSDFGYSLCTHITIDDE